MTDSFDINCVRCERLADFLAQIKDKHPDYHCRPVAPFGAARARLLIVGLAPGMHGANASGRPFTGDYAGVLLYETLHRYGFSNRPQSLHASDGLRLKNCRITNAVKCLPPANKPLTSEVATCNAFLAAEITALPRGSVIIALGTIAHKAVLRALGLKQSALAFGHNQQHEINEQLTLIDSYHCSRYNTQTRRLTEAMFHAVFERASALLRD